MKTAVLILAAGKGKRMQSDIPKQFMSVEGKPLFLYSVEKFLPLVDRTVLVTGEEDTGTCVKILSEYGLSGRVDVIAGGKERYDSSMRGLLYLEETGGCDTVLIHDAARACISEEVILRVIRQAEEEKTAVAAVPVKDTVKIAGPDKTVLDTPDRSTLFAVQTPQGFAFGSLLSAYRKFYESPFAGITDDASVMERCSDIPVKLCEGSYDNIKVTTPEDILFVQNYFKGEKQ